MSEKRNYHVRHDGILYLVRDAVVMYGPDDEVSFGDGSLSIATFRHSFVVYDTNCVTVLEYCDDDPDELPEAFSHFPVTDQSGTPMPPVDLTDGATRQSEQHDFGDPPEDDINHKNGLSKVYHGGHTYYPYNGNLMHDSDCICSKQAKNGNTADSEDLV